MQTLSQIRTYISEQIEDDSTDMLATIDTWINKSLKRLTDKYLWAEYSGYKSITPTAGVITAPPSFQGMNQIIPDDDTFGSFAYMSAPQKRGNRLAEPHYMDGDTRLVDGTVVSAITVANGDSTITATTTPFLASAVGHALLIGNDGYEYEITAFSSTNLISFAPAYRGVGGSFRIVVRPAGVRTFKLYDESDVAYASAVSIYYKKTCQPLYNDYDRPLIDADEAIKLGALMEALRNEKYSVDAERLYRDYESAVADARQSTVRPPRTRLPKGLLTPLPSFSFSSNRLSSTGVSRDF